MGELNMIQLKKITFKNFKIFGNDPYTINLDHNNSKMFNK
jgi:exonuclease SbcC